MNESLWSAAFVVIALCPALLLARWFRQRGAPSDVAVYSLTAAALAVGVGLVLLVGHLAQVPMGWFVPILAGVSSFAAVHGEVGRVRAADAVDAQEE